MYWWDVVSLLLQFVELERQNLELQDYIENLESQLEAIDRENASKQ